MSTTSRRGLAAAVDARGSAELVRRARRTDKTLLLGRHVPANPSP